MFRRVKEIFEKYVPIESKLISAGFERTANGLHFVHKIEEEHLELEVLVSQNSVNYQLTDTDFAEEYASVESSKLVKGICEEYFESLRERCFSRRNYASEIANIVDEYIFNKYGVRSEFPWKKGASAGVYRNARNQKWFGIIMSVKYSTIDKSMSDDLVEVMNVKSDCASEVILQKGIYPAYHMNKKSWITLVLDGSLPKEKIFELIDESYTIVNKKATK